MSTGPSAAEPRARVAKAALACAALGPALLCFAWMRVVGSPSIGALVGAGALAALVLASDGVLVATRRRASSLAALPAHVALAVLLAGFRSAPLPAPPVLEEGLPSASPPAGMRIWSLPTGVTRRTAAFGYRGGSPFERRDFTMTAVLVEHPSGDVLVDTGFGRSIDAQIQLMPWHFRAVTSYERRDAAADRLDAAGYDRSRLRAILLTHAHWDHVSGVPDFPGVPVWIAPAERPFIDDGGWITAVARSASAARYETYDFEGGPYLGFDRSHDVFGDGAIVVVPAPGHTPGSVIVFVTLPGGTRFAFVGDLVWQVEGITEREPRPSVIEAMADFAPAETRASLRRMAAVAARFPEMVVVPAHDARAFASIPELPAGR